MGKFLEIHTFPKVSKQATENLNELITNNKIKLIIQDLFTKKHSDPDGIW